MARIAATVVLALALCGCISAEERAARIEAQNRQAQAEQQARDRAYTENLTRQCAAIGYQAGTDGMRQCILQLHSQAQAQNAQMRGIILQQYLQQQREDELRNMPRCPNNAYGGYMRSQGTCR